MAQEIIGSPIILVQVAIQFVREILPIKFVIMIVLCNSHVQMFPESGEHNRRYFTLQF